ncbi:fluoride efflux transporter FluC [Nocardiopsis coralliicola]
MGRLTSAAPSRAVPPAALALLAAGGGAAGTALRALLDTASPSPAGWPWTTLAVNAAGSLVLGALLEALARSGPDDGARRAVRVCCGTGLIGGFTTYSAFALQVQVLLGEGGAAPAAGYALVSTLAGVAAACAGIALSAGAVRALRTRRAR